MGAVLTEFLVYAIGGAAQRVALLVLVPLLGALFSAADFGRWTIFIALAPMLTAIVDFGFSKAIGRFYFDYDDDRATLAAFLRRAIWLRFTSFTVLGLPVILALYSGWPILTGGMLPSGSFVAPLVVACACETVTLAVTAFTRARHISSVFGLLRLGQATLTVVLPYVFAKSGGLQGAVMGLAVANIITALAAIVWVSAWIRRQPTLENSPARFSDAGMMISYSAPVVVHDLSWWVRNSSTLLILSHFAVASLVGAYSIGFAALSVVAMLSWSLDFATAPYYYLWRKKDLMWRKNARDILTLMNGLVFIACSVGILLFAHVREGLFGTKFSEADLIGPLLLVAGMLQPLYFMTVKPYFFLKRTALLSRITFSTSVTVVIVTIVAVWQFGYLAAAVMTIVSFCAVALIAYRLSLRLEPSPFDLGTALIPTGLCATLAGLTLTLDLPIVAALALSAACVALSARLWIFRPLRALQACNAFQT
jgi:O-antigen/teichoic acid export membrane protein